MDQHWKSVMASVKIRGNELSDFALFTTYKLSQVGKQIRRYRINVKT